MLQTLIKLGLMAMIGLASVSQDSGEDSKKNKENPVQGAKPITLADMEPKFSQYIKHFISKELDPGDRTKFEKEFKSLGGIDNIPSNLKFSYKKSVPEQIKLTYDAKKFPKPTGEDSDKVRDSVKDLVTKFFTRIKTPTQVGNDNFLLEKGEAEKVLDKLPGIVKVEWRPEQPLAIENPEKKENPIQGAKPITLADMEPKFSEYIKHFISKELDPGDRTKLEKEFKSFGGIDNIPSNLKFSYKKSVPEQIKLTYDAKKFPKPTGEDSDKVRDSVKDLVTKFFTRIKTPTQVGNDNFLLEKGEAEKVLDKLPGIVKVEWRPEQPLANDIPKKPDPKFTTLGDLQPDQFRDLIKDVIANQLNDQEKAVLDMQLKPAGGLNDNVHSRLKFTFGPSKLGFSYDATKYTKPKEEAAALAVRGALDNLIRKTFTQIQKIWQVGPSVYYMKKEDADRVLAELPGIITVQWRTELPLAKVGEGSKPWQGGQAQPGGRWVPVPGPYVLNCHGYFEPTQGWAWVEVAPGLYSGIPFVDGADLVFPAPERLDLTGLKSDDAPRLFWRGYNLFWEGDYAKAWQNFDAAAGLGDDARYWYFKALSELSLGRQADAVESRRRGAQLQAEAKPSAEAIGRTLERVQGPRRMWLREASE